MSNSWVCLDQNWMFVDRGKEGVGIGNLEFFLDVINERPLKNYCLLLNMIFFSLSVPVVYDLIARHLNSCCFLAHATHAKISTHATHTNILWTHTTHAKISAHTKILWIHTTHATHNLMHPQTCTTRATHAI